MSYITLQACNKERQMQEMDITVRVHFKQELHKNYPRWREFMNQLEKDFEEIAKKYFDDEYEIDTLSNHEYNQHPKSY